jgi:hypothetical protein
MHQSSTTLIYALLAEIPSGAVGKDCQRRLLSRPRFVRAVAPRIYLFYYYLKYPALLGIQDKLKEFE